MSDSKRVFEIMSCTGDDWQTYTRSSDRAVHTIAMSAARGLMKVLDKAGEDPGTRLSIADRLKVIEKAHAKFLALASKRPQDGIDDGDTESALRGYYKRLLMATDMSEELADRFLYTLMY